MARARAKTPLSKPLRRLHPVKCGEAAREFRLAGSAGRVISTWLLAKPTARRGRTLHGTSKAAPKGRSSGKDAYPQKKRFDYHQWNKKLRLRGRRKISLSSASTLRNSFGAKHSGANLAGRKHRRFERRPPPESEAAPSKSRDETSRRFASRISRNPTSRMISLTALAAKPARQTSAPETCG